MSNKISFEIDGNNFSNLSEFYDEIERKLTKNLDFKIGRNLDALNDVLRGGFGTYEYEEPFTLVWKNIEKSKNDFGYKATIEYYNENLKKCNPSNIQYLKEMIKDVDIKKGETLFEEIIGIIQGHSHITLKQE